MLPIFILLASCLVSLPPSCSPASLNVIGYEYMINRVLSKSKPLEDYVRKRKYPFEKHIITSADGYILTYHRVPHASSEVEASRNTTAHRHPILLVHGIVQSSAHFLAVKDGLAYKLADAGFDVWLANHRGNPYSKAHLHLNPRKHSYYWQFSFNEMGRYDLPAAVDFILYTTRKPTLSYIGFSMGTTMFWTFAHWWPHYMSKVDYMVGMAPIAVPAGIKMIMRRSNFGFLTTSLKAMNVLHFFEFCPYCRLQAYVIRAPCNNTKNVFCRLVVKLVCYLATLRENLLDYNVFLDSLELLSAGSSIKSLFHLLQVGRLGKFQMYDYGNHKNMRHYGGFTTPPNYDLSKVSIPVYLIPGGKDQYSVKVDTLWLLGELKTHGKAELLFEEEAVNYDHGDLFFAEEVNEKIHRPLVEKLNQITNRMLELRKTQERKREVVKFLYLQ